jgi:hypothetical protein
MPVFPEMLAAGSARTEEQQLQLLKGICNSFMVSAALLLTWKLVIAPTLPAYRRASPEDRVFLANAFVSIYPALTAPWLALAALSRLTFSDLEQVMSAPADDTALRSLSILIGFYLFDVIYSLYYRQMRSPLIVGHHLLPLVLWPCDGGNLTLVVRRGFPEGGGHFFLYRYVCLQDKAVVLALFFGLTEFTNVGQHTRMLLLKLGYESTRLYTVIGVSWVTAFFLIRILPSPFIFYLIVRGGHFALRTFGRRALATSTDGDGAWHVSGALVVRGLHRRRVRPLHRLRAHPLCAQLLLVLPPLRRPVQVHREEGQAEVRQAEGRSRRQGQGGVRRESGAPGAPSGRAVSA